jgi:hypothetical protein
MSQGLAFLIWLLCVGISAILLGYFIKQTLEPVKKEGFAVYTCPSGSSGFVTDEGETHCCNGDVVDNYCTGNLVCTLSPKSHSRLPTCSDLAVSEASAAGSSECPSSMPNYFAKRDLSLRGCSASQSTADGTAPSDPHQPQCILYPTAILDQVKLDSCRNVKMNATKAASCAAAEATASLPACAAAAAAARAPSNVNPACPAPPIPNFVITGDWVGSRIAVQKRHVLGNGNIVHAIQHGIHVKMVVTDTNNITITARPYIGSINDLATRASDMAKIYAMDNADGHYILSTAP